MMTLADAYRWEAERGDGEIATVGGGLSDCVRFSLLPQRPGLPRHDFTRAQGCALVRRFARRFQHSRRGLFEYLHCLVCERSRVWVRSTSGELIVTGPDEEVYL
jgi:hypothetical protein